jgi:hypothetical protein
MADSLGQGIKASAILLGLIFLVGVGDMAMELHSQGEN